MTLALLPSFRQTFAWLNGVSPETGAAINRWIGNFEAVGADGVVDFAEIQDLALQAQVDLMKLLVMVDIPKPDKKEAVLVIVGRLFDSIPDVAIPSSWNWLYRIPGFSFVAEWFAKRGRGALRAELLDFVDLAIETVYAGFLKTPQLKVYPPNPPAA